MPVLINEFEAAPPLEAPPPSSESKADKGDPGTPDAMRKVEAAMRVSHERSHRLAAY